MLNRTLKFELQGKTSQTSASSLHHLVGCVPASKKFWRFLQGSGRVAERRTSCRGLRWFTLPVALCPWGCRWCRLGQRMAFPKFPEELEKTALFWEGVGSVISDGRRVCFWNEGEHGACFYCPTAKPISSYLVAHKIDKEINFLFKNNGTLVTGLILALSQGGEVNKQ